MPPRAAQTIVNERGPQITDLKFASRGRRLPGPVAQASQRPCCLSALLFQEAQLKLGIALPGFFVVQGHLAATGVRTVNR
jgi:hypothetical protein